MADERVTIQPRVSRSVYQQFKALCHKVLNISMEKGIEIAMQEALKKAGMPVGDEPQDSADA